jgi:predicted RNA binding protein YcfA (HicA-like mRNA interferase family)
MLREPSPSADSLASWLSSGLTEPLCTMESVKFRDIIGLIEDDGWRLSAQRGSHRQYQHPTKPGKVTVAGKPNADVPKGTAANILRQAGLRRPSR